MILITATIVLRGLGLPTSAGLYYKQTVDRSLTAEMLRPCSSLSVEFFIKTVRDRASISMMMTPLPTNARKAKDIFAGVKVLLDAVINRDHHM